MLDINENGVLCSQVSHAPRFMLPSMALFKQMQQPTDHKSYTPVTMATNSTVVHTDHVSTLESGREKNQHAKV